MADARLSSELIVDPLLSSTLGDIMPAGYILPLIAPAVEVYSSAFKFRKFGKEKLRAQSKTTRPLGGKTERTSSDYTSVEGKVVEHGLKTVLDRREIADAEASGNANAMFDIRLDKALLVKSQILQGKEAGLATVAMDPATYAAANK